MLRRLIDKLRRVHPEADQSPLPPLTYADLFEIMRYDRCADTMPYMIGFRPKPPLVDPTGPEPNFAILDTDVEVEDFMRAFNGPIPIDPPGVVSVVPLLQWNEAPSALMAQMLFMSFYHPDDETQGWPFLQVFALSPDVFARGDIKPEQTARGRYGFQQFPPEDKERYAREFHEARADGPGGDIYIGGKLPFSMIDMLNPRPPKGKMQ